MKGDIFVNKECIGCEACIDILPDYMGMKKDRAYVKRQPKTQEERNGFADVRAVCPMDAIRRKTK